MEILLNENDRIYFNGDMANFPDFGVIKKRTDDKWGINYEIHLDDGRIFHVSAVAFSKEYKGHGGTRFVTEKAYYDFRNKQIEALKKKVGKA